MSTSSDGKNIATTGSDHVMPGPMPATSNGPTLTPAGVPVPTPYQYIANSSTAEETEAWLEVRGVPALVVGSPTSTEPPGNSASQPTGGDIITFAVCGRGTMFSGSSGLTAGGQNVCRTQDKG